MHLLKRISACLTAAALGLAAVLGTSGAFAQDNKDYPAELRLDWGYYSPHTLLIKDKQWLEEAFKDVGTKITWVQSRGSNNSLEFLKTGATDFAGSAGLAAFIARANGVPLKIIYNASWGGSSILQVPADSPIQTVADLKGKQVAATKGTDPYFTLLEALSRNDLKISDIRHVHLQHPEGFAALQQKQVDAWIGIDPHAALAQIGGARAIFYDKDLRQPSVFSVSESFLRDYPKAVDRVLRVWADTQQWIKANPEEHAELVAEQTQTNTDVTRLILSRRDWSDSIPEDNVRTALRQLIPLVQAEGILRRDVDVEGVLAGLLDPEPAKRVLGQ